MPDTPLSLVRPHASDQRTGRVTLLERMAALDALAEIAGQARGGHAGGNQHQSAGFGHQAEVWTRLITGGK